MNTAYDLYLVKIYLFVIRFLSCFETVMRAMRWTACDRVSSRYSIFFCHYRYFQGKVNSSHLFFIVEIKSCAKSVVAAAKNSIARSSSDGNYEMQLVSFSKVFWVIIATNQPLSERGAWALEPERFRYTG